MTDPLLTIKLYAPHPRPGSVDRPRLFQKLDQGLEQAHRLTLVSAPAGYGKTTLVVEWLKTLDRPSAWLSLERSDNHPAQFFGYLLAALQQIDPKIGRSFMAAYRPNEAGSDWLQAQLPELINEITAVPAPFVLVLDDYHTISDLAIHEALSFLLDHQPPPMHLVMITRQDPLLRLSRQRSQGLVTGIRLGDLRFTEDEAAAFLNETMKLNLAPEQIASLEARTEGWIAGLQLAAISLSEAAPNGLAAMDPAQRSQFIDAFAGDDRHVTDYLMDEVLTRQPESVQRFLLHTSVLKHFCGSLCDEMLEIREPENRESSIERGQLGNGAIGQPGGDVPNRPIPERPIPLSTLESRSSQAILEYLEKSNLFLLPLDNRRQWYRYHHLFADLLANRLQTAHPELIPQLHCRASQWYERAGMAADAVDHALLAEDFDRALGLIEQAARASIWGSGDLPVLLNWSNRLPEEAVRRRPRLCLYYARALFFAGQVTAAEEYLLAAAQALGSYPGTEHSTPELLGVLYTNQATFAAMRGESQKAIDLAHKALPLVPEEDASARARVYHAIGMGEYFFGRVQAAEIAYSQAVQLAQMAGNRNLRLDVAACLANTLLLAGHPCQGLQVCEEALAVDEASRLAPAASAVYIAQAEILYTQNELQAALEKLEIGVELARQVGWAHVLWRAFLNFSGVKRGLGDTGGAQEALQQFELIVRRYNIHPVNRLLETWRARVALSLGNLPTARRWIATYKTQSRDGTFPEFEDLTAVRVLLAQKRTAEALALLDARRPSAEKEGRIQSVIEILTFRSIALKSQGMIEDALESLSSALALAEPEGFARIFLDRPDALVDLIRLVRHSRATPAVTGYAGKLLAAIEQPEFHQPVIQFGNHPTDRLVEPLSEREVEVIQLIANGLSKPEIARRLFLSVNTLRAHTANIYRKLDVHNRVQAAARAREVGLIPK